MNNMKIQIVSDLHIERYDDVKAFDVIKPHAEILVMAGDIGSMYRIRQLYRFLTDVCSLFKVVIYVPGNHEYYRIPKLPPRPFSHLEKSMLRFAAQFPNFFYLSRNSMVIEGGDNRRYQFIGATLWSKSDHVPGKIVRIDNFDTERYNSSHELDKKFIKDELAFANKNGLVPVVITHYPPLNECLAPNRKNDKFVSLYVNDLEDLVVQSNIWIYGHTHYNTDRKVGNCRVISNQLGKKKDNIQDFSAACVVKI